MNRKKVVESNATDIDQRVKEHEILTSVQAADYVICV